MVALTELWRQNSLWLWIRSCSSKCLSICQINNIHVFSPKNLNRCPRACQCQSSCHLKRFSPLSVAQCMCQSLMGAQIAIWAPISDCCSPTLNPHQYSIFASFFTLSSLRVWQVSAAQDEVNTFKPANVFSMLERRRDVDNLYKLINSTVCEQDRKTKWKHIFDQVTTTHRFKHWYLFIKTSTLLIFFFLL